MAQMAVIGYTVHTIFPQTCVLADQAMTMQGRARNATSMQGDLAPPSRTRDIVKVLRRLHYIPCQAQISRSGHVYRQLQM